MGKKPYVATSRTEYKEELKQQVLVNVKDIPDQWSVEAADFINKCLLVDPKARLGAKGIKELLSHPWFKDTDWNKLQDKKIPSPTIPDLEENFY
jgi:serine/threonine protein kinase